MVHTRYKYYVPRVPGAENLSQLETTECIKSDPPASSAMYPCGKCMYVVVDSVFTWDEVVDGSINT